MTDEEDLEEAWVDIRPVQLVKIVRKSPLDLKVALDIAAEKAAFKLRVKAKDYIASEGETHNDLLQRIVVGGVKTFLDCWYEELKSYDLAGLVEIVLGGQDLTPSELSQFVRALPQSLLDRICASSIGAEATGVHALMSLESARRAGELANYTLNQDIDGTLMVSFLDANKNRITVRLDETFKVPVDS